MVENFAVYLSDDRVEWKAALPGSSTNGGFMKKATRVEWATDEGTVGVNLMQGVELKSHLQGLAGFIQQTTADPDLAAQALAFTQGVSLCLGIELPQPVAEDGAIISRFKNIAKIHGGALFIHNCLLRNGEYLSGELAGAAPEPVAQEDPVPVDEESVPEPNTEPVQAPVAEQQMPEQPASETAPLMTPIATVQVDPDEMQYRTENPPSPMVERRQRTLAHLAARGFTSAESLPIGETEPKLRPANEIAARLGAAAIAYLWAVAPASFVSDNELQSVARMPDVIDGHTQQTVDVLALPREQANQQYAGSIGWTLENMWALAWALGFPHELEIDSGMIGEAPSVALRDWMPIHGRTMTSILQAATPRSVAEVADAEDLFYCAHNAVRSAQTGSPTVPDGFDAASDGGTVHERRHGLTWCLSPGTPWDHTDLST